ncbi:MAG: hypothetical protein Q8O86_10470 [Dehalococcoidia bacterium]|nr:hypothetical protein [Dehalococcoidia bacterium]
MRVRDLSVEDLKALIGEVVEEKLKEVLGDPDWGQELRPEIVERLRKSLAAMSTSDPHSPYR